MPVENNSVFMSVAKDINIAILLHFFCVAKIYKHNKAQTTRALKNIVQKLFSIMENRIFPFMTEKSIHNIWNFIAKEKRNNIYYNLFIHFDENKSSSPQSSL